MEGKRLDSEDTAMMPMICMRDKKSRVWPGPGVYHGVEVAKRELVHAAKYGKGVDGRPPLFAEYPNDFQLVLVGHWDSRTGAIIPCNIVICEVADLLKTVTE